MGIGTTSPNVAGYGGTQTIATIQGTGGGILELAGNTADGNTVVQGDLGFSAVSNTATSAKRNSINTVLYGRDYGQ